MDSDELSRLRDKIQADISALLPEIHNLEQLSQPIAPDNAIGRLTRMDAINTRSVNETALKAARLKMAALKRALPHLDRADFGQCEECGQPIPMGRLMLMPESPRCVKCAE